MKVKKVIIVTNCMECPYVGKCSAWEKLTAIQKFTLQTATKDKFILKDCPLDDYKRK